MTLDRIYARILQEAASQKSANEQGAFAKKFGAYLVRKGHVRLLPLIARRYQELLSAEKKSRTIVVRTGHRGALERREKALREEIERIVGEKILIEARDDDKLIGGYVAQGCGIRIDRSFKSGLEALYRKIMRNHA